MTEELMTSAVCWEHGAAVSVDFAHTDRDLYYFCPDPTCLVRVVPAKLKNFYFRAPESHVPGCVNEKQSTNSSPVPMAPQVRHALLPAPIIPTHLGPLARKAKTSHKPTMSERRALASQVKAAPVLHPGTLQEVVDAWSTMSHADRNTHRLQIAGNTLTYFDAFGAMGQAGGDIALLRCKSIISFGSATVRSHGDSYYISSRSRFDAGDTKLSITIRVKPSDPYFSRLENVLGGVSLLMLHGVDLVVRNQKNYFDFPLFDPPNPYAGFALV